MSYKPKKCTICGKEFTPRSPSQKRCSDECASEHQRRYQIRYYHQNAADINRRRLPQIAKRYRERIATDPEYVETVRANKTRSNAKLRLSTDYLERTRIYQREYARARLALMKLDPATYEQWLANNRERYRDYRRDKARAAREERRADPEKYAAYITRERECRRKRELHKLQSILTKIGHTNE